MDQLDLIRESINALWSLQSKDVIYFDDLHRHFRQDLQSFIVGETLQMKDGKLVIGRNLYKKWLEKIRTRGIDYEIDFKE